jgi:GAF domain-containing protein
MLHSESVDRTFIANLVRLASEAAGAHGATLYLVDGEVMHPYVIHNLSQEYIDGIGAVRVGTQCCGRAVQQRKPWIVSDMLSDPLFADGCAGALRSNVRAAFSVPVIDGQNVVGSLACHYREPHEPRNVDIERNENFAKLIAMALRELRGPVSSVDQTSPSAFNPNDQVA